MNTTMNLQSMGKMLTRSGMTLFEPHILSINSGGTEARLTFEVIGSRTFFDPLSRHTCCTFTSISTFIIVYYGFSTSAVIRQ